MVSIEVRASLVEVVRRVVQIVVDAAQNEVADNHLREVCYGARTICTIIVTGIDGKRKNHYSEGHSANVLSTLNGMKVYGSATRSEVAEISELYLSTVPAGERQELAEIIDILMEKTRRTKPEPDRVFSPIIREIIKHVNTDLDLTEMDNLKALYETIHYFFVNNKEFASETPEPDLYVFLAELVQYGAISPADGLFLSMGQKAYHPTIRRHTKKLMEQHRAMKVQWKKDLLAQLVMYTLLNHRDKVIDFNEYIQMVNSADADVRHTPLPILSLMLSTLDQESANTNDYGGYEALLQAHQKADNATHNVLDVESSDDTCLTILTGRLL